MHTVVCAGDDSAYRLLFSSYHAGSPILDKGRTKVFQMSAFKDDQSSEAQKQMIGEIRKAIECGDTCFLMYTEAIHGSLYDLFNQFFTVQRDKDQNAKLYVQIGIGSYSKVRRYTAHLFINNIRKQRLVSISSCSHQVPHCLPSK